MKEYIWNFGFLTAVGMMTRLRTLLFVLQGFLFMASNSLNWKPRSTRGTIKVVALKPSEHQSSHYKKLCHSAYVDTCPSKLVFRPFSKTVCGVRRAPVHHGDAAKGVIEG